MTIKNFFIKYPFLFIIAFIEGGIIMAIEVMGGNILATFYGSSIYLWTGILALSLAGLAAGYLIASKFSENISMKKLFFIILGISFFTTTIPLIADYLIPFTLNFEIRLGVIVGCFLLLFPVMLFCGIVSPYIIQLITIDGKSAGKNAGIVYFVSTFGGIVFTFITGFWIMPSLGIRKSLLVLGLVVLFFGFINLIKKTNAKKVSK